MAGHVAWLRQAKNFIWKPQDRKDRSR